jgi:formyltetrahydrofolate deformylase
MHWSVRFSDVRPRVAIFASREPHCLTDLLARWSIEELPAEIPAVISNHEDHRAIAEHFGVAYHHLPIGADGKAAQEQRALALLQAERVDLVVLARYMQILSPAFVDAFRDRIINIHHSFLPAFAGARPYHQAHERGVKVIGATAHYVTAELDQGPIIEQDVTRVSHRDTVEDLVRKGRDLEKVVLARAVRRHLTHRVLIYGNKTVVFD